MRTRLLLLVILLVCMTLTASAQDDSNPLVLVNESLYWLDGDTLTPTAPGNPVIYAALSPDGQTIAVMRIAQVVLDNGMMSGAIPTDFSLVDVASGVETLIAAQPDPVSYGSGTADNTIARSAPVWSPDDSQVAWTEYTFDGDTISLGVYTLASGETRTSLLDFPEQYGVPSPVPFEWLNSGIAIESYTYNRDTGRAQLQAIVYDANGVFVGSTAIRDESETYPYSTLFAQVRGRDTYAQFDAANGRWVLIDLLGQSESHTNAYPALVSRTNPEASLRVQLLPPITSRRDSVGQDVTHFQAQITDASGAVVVPTFDIRLADDLMEKMAMSPDGQTVAFVPYGVYDGVYGKLVEQVGVTSGTVTFDHFVDQLSWGAMEWVFPNDAILTPLVSVAEEFVCDGALATRLAIEVTAMVAPGSPNRLRLSPSLDGEPVGQIPSGEQVILQDGPVCADGIVWWGVTYDGITGWTAEGVDSYFLEPAGAG